MLCVAGFGDGYEGILLEGDGGLHGAGDLMPDPLVPPYDSQLLDWDADLLQQQWQQQPQLDEEPCQGSGAVTNPFGDIYFTGICWLGCYNICWKVGDPNKCSLV